MTQLFVWFYVATSVICLSYLSLATTYDSHFDDVVSPMMYGDINCALITLSKVCHSLCR